MAHKKIALIGAGHIGGELANLLVEKELGDIVLFDIPKQENVAKGKALDLAQASALRGHDVRIVGTSRWEECAGADVLIITAGIPRRPGQSRDDLVSTNLPIIREVADQARELCPNAFVVVVSNPLDSMVYEFKRCSRFPRERVVGMAGTLDSARFSLFLSREAGISVKDVRTMVLGGHGDDMVPVLSCCTLNGVPATQVISKDRLELIVQRTRSGGGEIVELLGTSAHFAPAAGAIAIAESHLLDQKRMLPCAAYLEGEYGYRDLYLGVPVIIGAQGAERVVEVSLTAEEKALLARSAASVQRTIDFIREIS